MAPRPCAAPSSAPQIDEPAISPARPGIRSSLLAQPAGRQKGEQAIAEPYLDLPIDFGMAARAVGTARSRELGGQQAPGPLSRSDHGGQEIARLRLPGNGARHGHRPGGRLKRSAMDARGAARRSSS